MIKNVNPRTVCWFGLALMATGLTTSKVALSIGSLLILVGGIWQLAQQGFRLRPGEHKLALLMGSLFLLSIIGFFFTENRSGWLDDLRIKLPILLVPISVSLCAPFTKKEIHSLLGLFVLTQLVIGGASLIAAYSDYSQMFQRVSANASVPVITGLNHIYFGPALGLAGLIGLSWGWRQNDKRLRMAFVIGGLLCALFLHLFTSRTGFMAFYAGIGGWILWLMIDRKAWLWGLVAVVLIASIPVLAYYTVPTFNKRVHVTTWDIEQFMLRSEGDGQADFSGLTVGLRFVAWKASYQIWQESPVLGTGLGDMEEELYKEYQEMGVKAKGKQLLRSSHNQYMEYLAGAGVVGVLWLLAVLLLPLLYRPYNSEALLWIHTAMLAASCLSESFLERQVGVAFYILFGLFFATLGKK
jgi:O-antigen ligase